MPKFAPPRPRSARFDPTIEGLKGSAYRVVRRFLAKNVRPRYPHFLYKYKVPVARRDEGFEYLRHLLVEGWLWLSSPRDFNDPFDMTANVVIGGTPHQIRQRYKQLIADKGPAIGMRWKQRRQKLDELMSITSEARLAKMKEIHEKNAAATGVFSFAGDPRSVLMWSHYSDHHTGVCLQFELARDPGTLLEAVPAHYIKDYPVFDWVSDIEDGTLGTLLGKFEQWRYENEWRIVWPDGARTYLKFKPEALVGVILGCRASDGTRDTVRELLKMRAERGLPALRTYVAKKHPASYALTIHRTELLLDG